MADVLIEGSGNGFLKLEFPPGSHIDDNITHCFHVLKTYVGIHIIVFEFNGIEVKVDRSKTPEMVATDWYDTVRFREKTQNSNQPQHKKDNPFYMVFVKDGDSPKYKHYDYDKAVEEANRLAKLTGKEVFVLGTINKFLPPTDVQQFVFKVKELK